MDIFLQTNSDAKRLEFIGVRKEGQDYSCNVVIDSRGFKANLTFYFDVYGLKTFLENLATMQLTIEGEAVLRHQFEEDMISFTVNSLGHVVVTGFLVEHSDRPQELRFCFETDQTVLGPLLEQFRALT